MPARVALALHFAGRSTPSGETSAQNQEDRTQRRELQRSNANGDKTRDDPSLKHQPGLKTQADAPSTVQPNKKNDTHAKPGRNSKHNTYKTAEPAQAIKHAAAAEPRHAKKTNTDRSILAEGAIALSVTLSGGALFAS